VVAAFIEEIVSAQKNVELQIVVGTVAGSGFQYAAFAAPVTAAEQQTCEPSPGNQPADTGEHLLAGSLQMFFQFRASIKSEPPAFLRVS